jgi:hypothetical protein
LSGERRKHLKKKLSECYQDDFYNDVEEVVDAHKNITHKNRISMRAPKIQPDQTEMSMIGESFRLDKNEIKEVANENEL